MVVVVPHTIYDCDSLILAEFPVLVECVLSFGQPRISDVIKLQAPVVCILYLTEIGCEVVILSFNFHHACLPSDAAILCIGVVSVQCDKSCRILSELTRCLIKDKVCGCIEAILREGRICCVKIIYVIILLQIF